MIKIKDRFFKLEIEYKANKNMYLRVKDGATLKITCPKSMNKETIISFIYDNEDRIFEMINKIEKRVENSLLKVGKTIFYRGKEYKLTIFQGKNDLKILKDEIIIYSNKNDIEAALTIFYEKSKKILLDDIIKLQGKYLKVLSDYNYNLMPNYKFRLMKSRWGVCYTKKNEVVINGYLIHFDIKCLEAVLWHELLHFVIPNHSKRFHEVLEYHMGDYKEIMRTLR